MDNDANVTMGSNKRVSIKGPIKQTSSDKHPTPINIAIINEKIKYNTKLKKAIINYKINIK